MGFIRKLPHHLVASFRATLEEVREADMLLHVVDASHHDWEGQMHVVERVLAELDLADRPDSPVFNKIDAVPDPAGFAARVRELYPGAITSTTQRTDGLAALKSVLRDLERAGRPTVRVRLPVDRRRPAGRTLSRRRSALAGGPRRASTMWWSGSTRGRWSGSGARASR